MDKIENISEVSVNTPDSIPPLESWTAAYCISSLGDLISEGTNLRTLWRHGVIQPLDFYFSLYKSHGLEVASKVFETEPKSSGVIEIDVAIAAAADYVARLHSWEAPKWVHSPWRKLEKEWFVAEFDSMYNFIKSSTPQEFLSRKIVCEEIGLISV